MTKWIVVGVVVLAAACLTERASAQVPVAPLQESVIVPADTVTMVPVVTRGGLFGRRRVVTTMSYPPVVQQPVVPATVVGTPATGIQPAQGIAPAPAVVPQTGPVVVPSAPVYYQVRRGLFGRLRVRTVRY